MISKRLRYIIDITDNFNVIADIGTDHGYVAVGLLQEKKAHKVISSDISSNSLQKAIDYVKSNYLEDKIDTRVGSGLSVLQADEADAIIIAGMGGVLISKILEDDYDNKFSKKSPTLILQPVQQARHLRYYLYENNFDIIDEHYIDDMGKYYHIMIAKKYTQKSKNYMSLQKNKDVFLEYGILNISKKNQLIKNTLQSQIEKNKTLLKKLKDNNVSDEYIQKIVVYLKQLEEVYDTF
ncbi:MAG: SAM-dependent methyltransferase [Peptostreptococcaceae bacterium]|nr:SAM-dependent methyltransferase [Peptostreptococcaceae bacterium]